MKAAVKCGEEFTQPMSFESDGYSIIEMPELNHEELASFIRCQGTGTAYRDIEPFVSPSILAIVKRINGFLRRYLNGTTCNPWRI
jgi:hypothetical protein